MTTPRLLALSDLHVAHPQNREIVAGLRPGSAGDWLLLAGDVGELYPDIEWGRYGELFDYDSEGGQLILDSDPATV